MSCMLRLSGPFAVLAESLRDAFVTFDEAGASRRARDRGETESATFNAEVSGAGGGEVPVQIREAEQFLARHLGELIELRARPGVDSAFIDFAWDFPADANGQFNRFPTALLTLCVQCGLGLEVSVYPSAAREED